MNKTAAQWALVRPDAFLTGSLAQARNVIEMALQDIADLDRLGWQPISLAAWLPDHTFVDLYVQTEPAGYRITDCYIAKGKWYYAARGGSWKQLNPPLPHEQITHFRLIMAPDGKAKAGAII